MRSGGWSAFSIDTSTQDDGTPRGGIDEQGRFQWLTQTRRNSNNNNNHNTKTQSFDRSSNSLDEDNDKEYVIEEDEESQSRRTAPTTALSSSVNNHHHATKNHSSNSSCCARLVFEFNPFQPWFTVNDGAPSAGQQQLKVDIPESFAPASCAAFLWKCAATSLALYILVQGVQDTPGHVAYLAYFTNWGVVTACAYLLLSLLNTVLAGQTTQPALTVGLRIRLAWILFEIAAHTLLLVALLFWVTIYDPNDMDFTFDRIAPHSVMAVLVWVDGLYCNNIPVRWFHWYGFILPFELLFLLWSFVHAYYEVSLPTESNNDFDEILENLKWMEEPYESAVLGGIFCLGLSPMAYLVLWMFSLYTFPCCCYRVKRANVNNGADDHYDTRDQQSHSQGKEVEERSLFANWW